MRGISLTCSLSYFMFCIRNILRNLFSVVFQIGKLGVFRQPCQLYGSDGTVSLFGYDDLRNTFIRRIVIIIIITVDEHYHVGVLLDGSGLTQVRQHRAMIRSLLYSPTQLRQCQHRYGQLSGDCFQGSRNIGNLLLSGIAASSATSRHQL